MRKTLSGLLGAVFLLTTFGCGHEGPKNVAQSSDGKKLTVAVPKELKVTQGQEKKFSATVVREKMTDPIQLHFGSLPEGITIDQPDKISDDAESFFTLRAAKDAPLKKDASISLQAKSGSLQAAAQFRLTIEESLENAAQRKQDYEKEARGRLDRLEAQLEALQQSANQKQDEQAKASMLKKIAEQVEELGRARKNLDALKTAPVEEWQQHQPKVQASLDGLDKRVQLLVSSEENKGS
ncbi:MAG: hypothetical protein AB7K24_14005 [Gemmataceae bacterium]